MRRIMGIGVALAVLVAAAPAIGQRGDRPAPRDIELMERWLAGRAPGQPVSCIPLRQIRSTHYVGGQTILYRMRNGTIYRNDPPGGCPGLNSNLALETRNPTGLLCRGEIAFVRDYSQGFSPGACAMGDFVPYRPAR